MCYCCMQVNTFYNLVTGEWSHTLLCMHNISSCMYSRTKQHRRHLSCCYMELVRMSAEICVAVRPHADIYEWGWGTSFHFSPLLPGKSIPASEAAHEARIAALLGLKVGC